MYSKKSNCKKLLSSFLKNACIVSAFLFCISISAQDKKNANQKNHHVFTCGAHQTPDVNSIQRTEIRKTDAVLPEHIVELESLSGAGHVIYLDFDGEPIDQTTYASPYDWTNEEITKIWEIVAEDFAPFNINVTTKRELYDALPNHKKVMAIFTSIYDVSVTGIGGAAGLDSFSSTGDNNHAWIYIKDGNTASHEVGHTMGLNHDTYTEGSVILDQYYDGHNNWGPIMGSGYREVKQWSKGEYTGAGNTEDDLAIIASDKNGFGYRADDHSDLINKATAIVPDAQGNVIITRNKGVIGKNTDKDVFSFTTIGGEVELFFRSPFKKVIGFWDNSNLNIKVRLLDSNGTEIMYSDPEGLEANITTNLQAGTYYLEIDGVGEGENPSIGYSDYASLGHYVISGKYPIDTEETQTPSNPTNLVVSNITQTSLTLAWEASTDNTAVEGYEVYRDNQLIANVEGTSVEISGLSRDTFYDLKVRAKDVLGNASGFTTITIRTAEIPSEPKNLKAFDITTGSLTLSWTKSIDYTEVVEYNVYQNNELIGVVNGTTYDVTGLNFGTNYSFKVAAKDALGNLSDFSFLTVRTGEYCKIGFNREFTDDISRVQLEDIDNTSSNSPGYEDYTHLSATLTKGTNHTITISPEWFGTIYEEGYSVWIDYNRDGDFEDEGEQIFTKTPTKDTSISGDFMIPNHALNGSTRIRIAMKSGGIPESCETLDYGEVEDYTVNIIEGVAPTCTDGIQNGDETGIDCGGPSCAPCLNDGTVVYVDIDDITTNSTLTWNPFRIEVGDNDSFGAWYSGNTIRLIASDKKIICEGTTSNITFLGEGVEVGTSNNFVSDSHSFILSSSTYTSWNSKSGYIGFSFKINGATHYGWFYATVSANGSSYTIEDYAYNTTAGQSLITKRQNTAATKNLSASETNTKVSAYPNPFETSFILDVSQLKEDRFNVKIYSILGEEIFSQEYNEKENSIAIGKEITLPGIYLVKVLTPTNSETLQIVKH